MNLKNLNSKQKQELEDLAYKIRVTCLEFITSSGWGHVGGSLSEADLLACLYGAALQVSPDKSSDEMRDRFILSKAHTSPALYATLALKGFFPFEKLYEYCRLDGLDGHTQRDIGMGIEYSGGSLGTGLSYSVGIARALRQRENFISRVVCLIGDGECTEGQIWEAAMFASHNKLDNLIAIVDYNKVMAKGKMSEMISVDPLEEKWKAFGWKVISIDGHDVSEICNALHRAYYLEQIGRPVCIIAHTVKGRGVPECEYNYQWHTHAPNKDKAEKFLEQLQKTYGRSGGFNRPIERLSGGELEDVITKSLV